MRLYEIAGSMWKGDFRQSEGAVLMTILNHLDSKLKDGTPVPFKSIAELMHNVGYNFTFKAFQELCTQMPAIKSIVTGIDDTPGNETLTLGKSSAADVDQQDKETTVDQMAKSATKANM